MLKKLHVMKIFKFTVITKERLSQLPLIMQPQSMKILNFSNVPLTQDEIDILKLRMSFTPSPKQKIAKLKNDIFQFTRKLQLTYHYRNNNIINESNVKLESTYTPKLNEYADLENIYKNCNTLKYHYSKEMTICIH